MEPRTSPQEAVEQIASARCQREQTCGNIGETKSFASRDHCMKSMRADAIAELADDQDCQNGISNDDLRECMEEVRNEDCGMSAGKPLDSLETMMACGSGQLCFD
jgi:hypothetical protein